jgi:cell division protein FtsW
MSASRSPDSVFFALIFGLCAVGIIVLASASTVISFQKLGNPNAMLTKQVISLFIGIGVLLLLARIDYHRWQKWANFGLIISIILVLILYIPGVGTELLGARRWIALGGIFFQPSELLKLAVIIFLANYLTFSPDRERAPKRVLARIAMLIGGIGVLLIFQPDLGTAIVITGIIFAMYFAAGTPLKYVALLLIGVIAAVALAITIEPYRATRLTVFLHPESGTQEESYHINQSLLAIGSGGLFGKGYGRSIQKFNYLPEAAGDSIFAIAAEELGFFLSLGIILLYLAVFWRGMMLTKHAPDGFAKLIMVGILSWITFQAFVNIGALTALLPLTGVPLPFISNGGTSLIFTLAAVGIFLNISRSTRV